jgi:hypothetical protein
VQAGDHSALSNTIKHNRLARQLTLVRFDDNKPLLTAPILLVSWLAATGCAVLVIDSACYYPEDEAYLVELKPIVTHDEVLVAAGVDGV